VVPGADYAMLERLVAQPTVERRNGFQIKAGVHKIAGVD